MNPALSSYRRLLRVIHSSPTYLTKPNILNFILVLEFQGDKEMVEKAITTIRGRYKVLKNLLFIVRSNIRRMKERLIRRSSNLVFKKQMKQQSSFEISWSKLHKIKTGISVRSSPINTLS